MERDRPDESVLARTLTHARSALNALGRRLSRTTHLQRALLGAAGGALAAVAIGLRLIGFVPCPAEASCITVSDVLEGEPLPEAIHIFDRDDRPFADVAGPRRRTGAREAPARLAAAFVAVEDRRYWDHDGVDVHGILRAALRNVRSAELEEGASTIPMQLARSIWAESLREVGPWRRKLFEARTAQRLVERLGRQRVLELYMDAIYLGDGLYGVEAASLHYFGKAPDSLDLSEVALLVGMTRSPENLDPVTHPEAARARRSVVLDLLVDAGVATDDEARAAADSPVPTETHGRDRGRGYATAAVTRELRRLVPDLAGSPGLRVLTTLDTLVQSAGERALVARLEELDPERSEGGEPLQGAAVALDPVSGAIRGWIGGRSFTGSEFDRVEQARRQVGSLVKPFVVAAALEDGHGILDLVSADTFSLAAPDGVWSPADHVDQLVLPVREALVRSSNRAAVRLGRTVGVPSVRRVGRQAGIAAAMPDLPSTLIGSFEATLLEMTAAYAVFGNGGGRVAPYLIRRIEARDGSVLWEREGPERTEAVDSLVAFTVLDALRDVVDRGTGWPLRQAGYYGPAAGKTGTTDDGRDAWFVGVSPRLAAGVWIGYDRPAPISDRASGGGLAAPVWARWLGAVDRARREGPDEWRVPEGMEEVRYDPTSGEVHPPSCDPGGGRPLVSAWVPSGSVDAGSCRGTVVRWLDGLWDLLRGKPDPKPVRDTIR